MSSKQTMEHMRRLYSGMSKGEKAYMANKLWKEDRIVAAKLKEYIPIDELYQPAPITYRRGQKFTVGYSDTEIFVLATIAAGTMMLISVSDGNRWTEGVTVKNSLKVTEQEFKALCGVGETFTLIREGK
jgi:hypothetical protein